MIAVSNHLNRVYWGRSDQQGPPWSQKKSSGRNTVRTRAFITTLLAASALTLSGCSTTDKGGDTYSGTDAGLAPAAASNPLAVCEPLNVFQDGINCVPGVGTSMRLKTKSSAPQGVSDFTKVQVTAPYKTNDTWVSLILSTYTHPSSGLTPAKIGAQLEVLDIVADKMIQTIDLGEARVDGLIPIKDEDLVAVVLTDKTKLRTPVGNSSAPKPTTELTMLAVRPSDGSIEWTKNDTLTSKASMVPVAAETIPAYLVPRSTCPVSTEATEAFGLDVTSGAMSWSIDLANLPGPLNNANTCTRDEVVANIMSPVVQITRAAIEPFYGDTNYNLRTNVLTETGTPLRGFEKSKITEAGYDPAGGDLAMIVADKGAGGDTGTYVLDRTSGEVKATVDTAAITAVGGKLAGFFDGVVYVKNGDEMFTLDAITGKELGPAKTMPVYIVNDWILHDNGTFTPQS